MTDQFRVLVVDDEPAQRELVAGFLRKHGFEVSEAGGGRDALARFRREAFELVLTDQRMADLSGLELLEAVRAVNPETAVIVVTAYGTIETAVSAIKAGAADYLSKPLNLDELLHRIHQVQERQRLLHENRELRLALAERHRVEGVIGESGQMQEVLSLVRRVASSDATVLIRGESGTGKELIAKAIHYASARAAGPLVKVNCAALPESLLESELFGHEKGAFTGAAATRKGRFELADGGFRDDLYYRINVVTIALPPLRERREDLPLLIDHFLRRLAAKNGKSIQGLARDAREALLRYDYPGNVRELENLIERAVVLTRGEVIALADLPLTLQEPSPDARTEGGGLLAAVEGLERRMIREALNRADGIQTRAADQLGISERVLRYKLRKYGLTGDSSE